MSADALKSAIELLHVPTNVRFARRAPLPEGAGFLLRIAAEDESAVAEAVRLSGRPEDVAHRAACFFIEQVLFSPDSDNYRILGASRSATSSELREHMALLLRWLHPDVNAEAQANSYRTNLARRVVSAWEQLKTPERRQNYDASLPPEQTSGELLRKRSRLKAPAKSSKQTYALGGKTIRPGALVVRKKNPLVAALSLFFRPRRGP